ncbi:hypothetical protein OCC_07461 [Thermococcus litoralis DSM 5473]|uniref:Uncharacterized protein n=1 Tax=Thermococcus litoralis (strain ATCC 51850 / DSM 5473 / JCM 8560 / NS-C) TaxID=523849 RepID=H3ZL57_THELN|nr:hypothetical protein [Thermococcus litoralis]EHR79307.1 hypothetical protein OCC_07461 [Thermococcus litoralis DSM 5473]
MKKFLIMMLLFMLPLASASQLEFYPNENAFEEFLSDGKTYYVITGESDYSKAWGWYVDEKLSRFKDKGDEVLVLVGNVYDNPEMKKLWNLTELPPEASLKPSVIVLNNLVFLTGDENNIYLIEKAFSQHYRFRNREEYTLLFAGILLSLFFAFLFSRHGTYTHFFYLLVMSLFALWISNSMPFTIGEDFLKNTFQSALLGNKGSLLSFALNSYFQVYSPTEEALLVLHLFILFFTSTLIFFTAPKPYRELGFLVFGLMFASPSFRGSITDLSTSISVFLLVLVAALTLNAKFTEESPKVIGHVFLLSLIVAAGSLVWPYLIVFPFFTFFVFPTKSIRNSIYVGLSITFFILGINVFSIPTISLSFDPSSLLVFLREGILQLILISYLLFNFRRSVLNMRGGKALFFWLLVVFIPLLAYSSQLFPMVQYISSALAVRLICELTLQT